MPEDKVSAEVTKVTKNPVVEGTEGARIGLYTVDAKVSAPEYSKETFVVRILEPVALGNFQHEQGSLMQDGEFQFTSIDEPDVGDKLEISVSPSVRSGLIT